MRSGIELPRGWHRVVEELVGAGCGSRDELVAALRERAAEESPALALLHGGVGEADLAAALAAASRTALVSLAPYPQVRGPIRPGEQRLASPRMVDPVEHAAARRLGRAFCESRGLVITSDADGSGVLAMADPLDAAGHREAERRGGLRLWRVTAARGEILAALDRAWAAYVELPVISLGDPRRGRASFLASCATVALAALAFLYVFREGLQPRYLFVFLALACGFLFFAYALRYYVASAAVLGTALLSDLVARVPRGEPRAPAALPRSRQPFVSVHLALYNERRVVDRLLAACTSFDYDNYEVVVVDDSTDDTVEALARWSTHPRVRVVHRASRAGFKGGALQEALRRTHPRAEYVMVFDADFVPPANVIWHFLDYFGRVPSANGNGNGNGGEHARAAHGVPVDADRLAAVQGYQWHTLNAGENWITKGIRVEFAGSYVLERAAQELFGTMKMIAGSVYMIRADVLRKLGWSTSITEDWELTIRLYLAGYRVLYTPYIQAPAECVSAIRRLIRQRMRWAEGHTFNVKLYWWKLIRSPNLDWREKLEFLYYAPYYLQSVVFCAGTLAWLLGVFFLDQRLPMWSEVLGWSLVITNALALPLMNLAALILEGSLRRDAAGLLSSIALSWILVPFQAYAALKALLEPREGGWARTPKSGRVTEPFGAFRLTRLLPWELPRRPKTGPSRVAQLTLACAAGALAAGIVAIGALSMRALAATGQAQEAADYAVPLLGTAVAVALLGAAWFKLKRRLAACVLIFGLSAATNVLFLSASIPANAAATNANTFYFRGSVAFGCVDQDMTQTAPTAATDAVFVGANNLTRTFCSDTFGAAQSMSAGTAIVTAWFRNTRLAGQNCVITATLLQNATALGSASATVPGGTTAFTQFTISFATPAVTFAAGDRLNLRLTWTPAAGGGRCDKTALAYDSVGRPSNVQSATIVPEEVLALLPLAAALPLLARRWRRAHTTPPPRDSLVCGRAAPPHVRRSSRGSPG